MTATKTEKKNAARDAVILAAVPMPMKGRGFSPMRTKMIAGKTGISASIVRAALKRLESAGEVRNMSHGAIPAWIRISDEEKADRAEAQRNRVKVPKMIDALKKIGIEGVRDRDRPFISISPDDVERLILAISAEARFPESL